MGELLLALCLAFGAVERSAVSGPPDVSDVRAMKEWVLWQWAEATANAYRQSTVLYFNEARQTWDASEMRKAESDAVQYYRWCGKAYVRRNAYWRSVGLIP